MKIYAFVAEDGEAAQSLVRQAQQESLVIDVLIADDPEGIRLRQLYDVVARPALLITMNDGSYVHMWQGRIPSIAEIAHVAQGRA